MKNLRIMLNIYLVNGLVGIMVACWEHNILACYAFVIVILCAGCGEAITKIKTHDVNRDGKV